MSLSEVRILVVDDEEDIIEFISYNLEKEGYSVGTAKNGTEAIEKAKTLDPHLIILDIMMPEINGIEVCRTLRALPEFQATLIAFLTARNEDFTQIAGFDVGGDDYISKPIRPQVLLSRIKALLRRSTQLNMDKSEIITIGDLIINKENITVQKNGEIIEFAKKEFELLSLLASKPGKVFTRREIFSKIWGPEVIVGDRTIDVHVRKLREKLDSSYIKTVKGIGYKFDF